MDKKNLKIDLRAAWYTGTSHVLEYRINPDQEGLEYTEQKSYLFGLIKRTVTKKYDTNWHQPRWFVNYATSKYYTYDDEFNWNPIWCEDVNTLNWYRNQLPTYGHLCRFIQEHNEKNKKEWEIDRMNYLENQKPIY